MSRLKLALVGALGSVVVASGLALSRPKPAYADSAEAAFKCPNDYCTPGSYSCPENTGTACSLLMGCSGWSLCP